ncbi:MAG: hypothetical protein KA419_17245 [Acidobacteria bacterium]|nr:hypothetical protein [Acidobacteriota bacterium]
MKTRELQTFLKHLLPTFRGTATGCPDENALTAFLEADDRGRRPDAALRRHLLRCPACLEKALLLGELTGTRVPLRAEGFFGRLWESPALRPALSGALVVLLAAAVYFGGMVPTFEKNVLEPSAPESALPAGALAEAPFAPPESPAAAAGTTAPGPAASAEKSRFQEPGLAPTAPPPVSQAREQGAAVPFAPAMADRVGSQAVPSPPPSPAPEKLKEEEAKKDSTETAEDNLGAFAPVPDRRAIAGARPEAAPVRGAEGAARARDDAPAATSAPPVAKSAVSRTHPAAPPAPAPQPPGAGAATGAGGQAGRTNEFARSKGQTERPDEADRDGKADDALRRLLENLCRKVRASSVRIEWQGRTCYGADGYLVESGLCDREIREVKQRKAPREAVDRKEREIRPFKGVFVAEGHTAILYVE